MHFNIRNVFDSPGYLVADALTNDDHSIALNHINKQWADVISSSYPLASSIIQKDNLSILDYTKLLPLIDHSLLWSKSNRVLSLSFVEWFLQTNFMNSIRTVFPDFIISDEENLGYANFYWRLVRPHATTDVGPIHRDSWFWNLNSDTFPSYDSYSRIKCWIDMLTAEGLNGLLVEPNSHKRTDILWHGEYRHGIKKPTLDMKPDQVNTVMIPTKKGQCVLFNDDLLHGGSLNLDKRPRISFEFTLLFKSFVPTKISF